MCISILTGLSLFLLFLIWIGVPKYVMETPRENCLFNIESAQNNLWSHSGSSYDTEVDLTEFWKVFLSEEKAFYCPAGGVYSYSVSHTPPKGTMIMTCSHSEHNFGNDENGNWVKSRSSIGQILPPKKN